MLDVCKQTESAQSKELAKEDRERAALYIKIHPKIKEDKTQIDGASESDC